jgi:hypothetical protein
MQLRLAAFLAVLTLLSALVPSIRAAEGDESFMLPLYEAVWTKRLTDAPPQELFTFAIFHDPTTRKITPPPEAIVRRLLSIKGVRADLFVPHDQLFLPDYKAPRKEFDVVPGVTKKGTDQRVDLCIASFIEWTALDELTVHWVTSSGPMAGGSGQIVFLFNKGRWSFVRYGETMEH